MPVHTSYSVDTNSDELNPEELTEASAMAGVRDPAFWRRFSMAVHMDEEKAQVVNRSMTDRSDSTADQKQLQHTDSWLERHRKKQRKAFVCGWVIVLITMLVLAGIAMVCLWFSKVGPFSTLR